MPNFYMTELGVKYNVCNCTRLCGGSRASIIIACIHLIFKKCDLTSVFRVYP